MIRVLPLFVGIVPVIGVAGAYWLNINAGVLPHCMPLLDGCTSISSTGRHLPGSMLFRAVLLPQAAFLVILWWFGVAWIEAAAPRTRLRRAILICGVVGALALVVYVTFLGTTQPFYEFMRRFGIYFYFLGTALSQIMLTLAMPRSRLRVAMLWVIASPFVLGILNLAQKLFLSDSGAMENRIEWAAALLMQLWFVTLYVAWRRSGFSIRISANAERSGN